MAWTHYGVWSAKILENDTCLQLVIKQNRKTVGLTKKTGLLIWTTYVTPTPRPLLLVSVGHHTPGTSGEASLCPPAPPTRAGGWELSEASLFCRGTLVTMAFC